MVSRSASSHATLGAADFGAADDALEETTRDRDDWNNRGSAAEVAIDGVGGFGVRVEGGRETTEAAGTLGSIETSAPDVDFLRRATSIGATVDWWPSGGRAGAGVRSITAIDDRACVKLLGDGGGAALVVYEYAFKALAGSSSRRASRSEIAATACANAVDCATSAAIDCAIFVVCFDSAAIDSEMNAIES